MFIGRLLIFFINALSRVAPGLRAPVAAAEADAKRADAEAKVAAERKHSAENDGKSTADNPNAKPKEDLLAGNPHTAKGLFKLAKELFNRFNADNCGAWAAALSFFSLLALPSVLLCGLAVLGFLIKSPDAAVSQTKSVIARLLPGEAAQAQSEKIIEQLNVKQSAEAVQKRRGVTGLIGVALLLWSAIQIFVNAATPMNAAFHTEEKRNWLKLHLTALGLLGGCGLLFLLSLLPAFGAQLLRSFHVGFASNAAGGTPLWLGFLLGVIAVAFNVALFTLIYRFLPSPSAKVTWREALVGGTAAAVLWEIAKEGFAVYLQRMNGAASYDKVYGAFGGLVLMVFWIYYSSMILLLGAEIAKLYSDVIARRGKAMPPL